MWAKLQFYYLCQWQLAQRRPMLLSALMSMAQKMQALPYVITRVSMISSSWLGREAVPLGGNPWLVAPV